MQDYHFLETTLCPKSRTPISWR